MAYFPLFLDLTKKECLVIGGSAVAYRKILMLLDFDAKVAVVSKRFSEKITELATQDSRVILTESEYSKDFLPEKVLVIVATDDETVNRQVADDCRACNIPVNVADNIENCSFILPSYVKQKEVVAAFSSSGKSPVLTQYLKKKEKDILTETVGDINETLGACREQVKKLFPTEALRKEVFLSILEKSVSENRALEDAEIQKLIEAKLNQII